MCFDDETVYFLKNLQSKFERKSKEYRIDGKNPSRDRKMKTRYTILAKDLKRIIEIIMK